MSEARFKVCVLQYRLLHYRTDLFDRLRLACSNAGIDLVLVHGHATAAESSRKDTGTLAWALPVNNRSVRIAGKDILWQPLPAQARDSDLVVLMQENRLVSNYPWLFGWRRPATRVAFWGHGRNFQTSAPSGWRERWKRWTLTKVDWWFAYTDLARQAVLQVGYPAARVTVLNNAIDNTRFEGELAAIGDDVVAALRQQIGAVPGSTVGLYCGSLYPDKRLDLLLAACERVVAQRPDFRLVVVGDGPSRDVLQRAASKPWLHWAGALRGADKAAWFRASQLFLSPGAVGLHVLDSFVAGTPMITTTDALHGPEVAYLEHDVNGLICAGNPEDYAQTVLGLIADPQRLERLRRSGHASALHYTLDAMVRNFTDGVLACLRQPRLPR